MKHLAPAGSTTLLPAQQLAILADMDKDVQLQLKKAKAPARINALLHEQSRILREASGILRAMMATPPTFAERVRALLNREEDIVAAMNAAEDQAEREGLRRERMALLRKICAMINRKYDAGLAVRFSVTFSVNAPENEA